MRIHGIPPRRRLFAAGLTVLALVGPGALAAQQNDSDQAEEAAAIARADSARAVLVQPPGSKPTGGATFVRAPFQIFGATLGAAAGIGYGVYKVLDKLKVVDALHLANHELESVGIKVRPDYIGTRSGIALSANWDGSGTPLFLEGGYSIRGYQLARGGLHVGDDMKGAELSVGHQKYTQVHFWGLGPDADLANEADYGWTRRDARAAVWLPVISRLRVGVEGGLEEDRGERGGDTDILDLVDRFPDVPFDALATDRFARVGANFDLDFTGFGHHYEQLRGVRVLGVWSAFRGIDDTDSNFQLGLLDARAYGALSRQHSLAFRGLVQEAFGEEGSGAPLYYLPRLGSSEGLRGEKGWRFRDRSAIAGQAEWRYQVWWHPGDPHYRLDAFVFVDSGAVAPEMTALDWDDFETTPGIGLRFMDHGFGVAETYLAFGGDNSPRASIKLGTTF